MYPRPDHFGIIPVLMMVLFIGIFGFALGMIFSPTLRGKMLAKQIKAVRHATDIAGDDLARSAGNLAKAGIETVSDVLDEKGDELKKIAEKAMDIKISAVSGAVENNSDKLDGLIDTASKAIGAVAHAVREGTDADSGTGIICKHCGAPVDSDSVYCKK